MLSRSLPANAIVAAVAVLFLAGSARAGGDDWSEVRRGFLTPPDSARPHAFWHWLNGHVSREGITADLQAMKDAGLGGFMLWNVSEGIPPGPVEYMGPQWWALLDHALGEAERLGLEMSIFNCAGWSQTGGPWVTPELSMQEVVWTERRVIGPATFDEVLEIPEPALGIERDMKRDPVLNSPYYVPRETVRGHYHDIRLFAFPALAGDPRGRKWRLANWRQKAGFEKPARPLMPDSRNPPAGNVVDPDRVIDLTDRLGRDGRLRWSVPPGTWTLLRIGHQPTGRQNHPAPVEGTGLEIDKHSAAAVDFFWDRSLAAIVALAGDRTGRTLRGIHIDSYEAGHQNWSAGLAGAFRRQRGYDIHPYLIALTGRVVASVARTEDFLWDFRATIGDLIARNYYGRFSELCRRNGLLLSCEPYGRYGNTDDHVVAAIPDVPMGEWWAFRTRDDRTHYPTAKLVSSAAHVHGRPIVDAEAFTGPQERIFQAHPACLKKQGDDFLCQGITRFSLHTFAHDPYDVPPGLGLGPYGSRFDRRNTWWPFVRPWMDYLARCQHLLRQGRFVADFLYYTGEDAPRQVQMPDELVPPPPAGYDFDYCDPRALERLVVREGRLVLPSGMSYRVLVLPDSDRMSLPMLGKIAGLVAEGAVVVGPRPRRAPGLAGRGGDSEEVARLADAVWGDCDGSAVTSHGYGRGVVYWNEDLPSMVEELGLLPDFEWRPAGGEYPADDIRWIHRRGSGGDIYFVSNQADRAVSAEAVLRTAGRGAELWDPDTGAMTRALTRTVGSERTAVTLELDPAGSVFVVFPPSPTAGLATAARGRRILVDETLPGPWRVSFQPGRGAPAAIALDGLIDLAAHPDPGVKHFSGIATYRTTFELPDELRRPDGAITVDLGEVQVAASLRLNGQDLGILWKAPFRVEATGALRPGRNELEIRVANLWINRLLGDRLHPDDCFWLRSTDSTGAGRGLREIPRWVVEGDVRPVPQRIGFVAWQWPHLEEAPLPSSGLIGPVRLQATDVGTTAGR